MYSVPLVLWLVALTNVQHNLANEIINATETTIENHPYQISIEEKNLGYICGGALIADHLVLTAAHCLGKEPNMYRVRAGTKFIEEDGITLDVQDYFNHIHFGYGLPEEDYDICVVRVWHQFPLGPSIQIIQLTDYGTVHLRRQTATMTGWGKTGELDCRSRVLQAVSVPTFDYHDCKDVYANIGKNVTSRMMCFGTAGRGFCENAGDPLVIGNKLIGIASWSAGCAHSNFPGVYVDIGNYQIWRFIQHSLIKP